MRHALGICGVLAAGVLLAVSAAMNWRFGLSLGMTELDGQIYGAASAAADCLKALIPFFFFAAIRNRMWSQATASAIVWVVVTGYSLTSAFGHAALNRDGTAGKRVAQAQTYSDLRSDLDRAQEQLSWVPKHRPAQTVQAELDNMQTGRAWKWTKGCIKVKGKFQRKFCKEYHSKVSELASADQAASLEARMASVRSQLGNTDGTKVMSAADPQIAAFTELTGVDAASVKTAMLIFIALLLEIGSGLGMYVAFSQWRLYDADAPKAKKVAKEDEPAAAPKVAQANTVAATVATVPEAGVYKKPSSGANDNKFMAPAFRQLAPKSDVELFYSQIIVDTEKGENGLLPGQDVYVAYQDWCAAQNKSAMSTSKFHPEFKELGLKHLKVKNKLHYRNVAIRSAETSTGDTKSTVMRAKAA